MFFISGRISFQSSSKMFGSLAFIAGVFFVFIFCARSQIVLAADGDLDLTFGTGGKLVTAIPGNDDYGRAVAMQPDGKIVIVGQTGVYPLFHSAILRYNPNGSLDPTFGSAG